MRPNWDHYFMNLARVVASRGTCARRQVGCVLVDHGQRLLSTGYNGPARGQPHCIDVPCEGTYHPSGQGLDECEAVHAEANALINCGNPRTIGVCYVTVSPCVPCVKLLMNTNCERIVFAEPYAHDAARELWMKLGRKWEMLT